MNEQELTLNTLIKNFYENKQELDEMKRKADNFNSNIKEIFNELDRNTFETDNGLVAKLTIQKRESFDEPKLIEKLKELDKSDAIDFVEVINWDKVEDLIYNGKLDASVLTEFKEVKEIQTLKVTKKKGE